MRSVPCLLFTPHGTVSVSSLDSFSSVSSSSKSYQPSLKLSLGVHRIQEHFKKKRGKKRRYINPQEEKVRREQQMKKNEGDSPSKVGCWLLLVGPHGIRI